MEVGRREGDDGVGEVGGVGSAKVVVVAVLAMVGWKRRRRGGGGDVAGDKPRDKRGG